MGYPIKPSSLTRKKRNSFFNAMGNMGDFFLHSFALEAEASQADSSKLNLVFSTSEYPEDPVPRDATLAALTNARASHDVEEPRRMSFSEGKKRKNEFQSDLLFPLDWGSQNLSDSSPRVWSKSQLRVSEAFLKDSEPDPVTREHQQFCVSWNAKFSNQFSSPANLSCPKKNIQQFGGSNCSFSTLLGKPKETSVEEVVKGTDEPSNFGSPFVATDLRNLAQQFFPRTSDFLVSDSECSGESSIETQKYIERSWDVSEANKPRNLPDLVCLGNFSHTRSSTIPEELNGPFDQTQTRNANPNPEQTLLVDSFDRIFGLEKVTTEYSAHDPLERSSMVDSDSAEKRIEVPKSNSLVRTSRCRSLAEVKDPHVLSENGLDSISYHSKCIAASAVSEIGSSTDFVPDSCPRALNDSENYASPGNSLGQRPDVNEACIKELSDISGLPLAEFLTVYKPGVSFSLGEGGRELLRTCLNLRGCNSRELQGASVPRLLYLAHEWGLWNVAVRIFVERITGRVSKKHAAFIKFKKTQSNLRKLFKRERMSMERDSTGNITNIRFEEIKSLTLGKEGREKLRAEIRRLHVREPVRTDELLKRNGFNYSALRNATVSELLEIAHICSMWKQVVEVCKIQEYKKQSKPRETSKRIF